MVPLRALIRPDEEGGRGGGAGTLRAKRGNPETVQEHIPNQLIYLLKYYFLSTKQNI